MLAMNQPLLLSSLPDDVQKHVLEYYDVSMLGATICTSKAMKFLAGQDMFWTRHLVQLLQLCFDKARITIDVRLNLQKKSESSQSNKVRRPQALSRRLLKSSEFAPWFHEWIKYHYINGTISLSGKKFEVKKIREYFEGKCALVESGLFDMFFTESLDSIKQDTRKLPEYMWMFQDVALKYYYKMAGRCFYIGQQRINRRFQDYMDDANRCIYCGEKKWCCKCHFSEEFFRERTKKTKAGFEGLPRIRLFGYPRGSYEI